MRLVTVIRFARSGGVSEKEKARETSCRDCESLFNPSFLTCFVSCVVIANSSFRCTLHLFFILLSQPTKLVFPQGITSSDFVISLLSSMKVGVPTQKYRVQNGAERL